MFNKISYFFTKNFNSNFALLFNCLKFPNLNINIDFF